MKALRPVPDARAFATTPNRVRRNPRRTSWTNSTAAETGDASSYSHAMQKFSRSMKYVKSVMEQELKPGRRNEWILRGTFVMLLNYAACETVASFLAKD